MAVYQPIWLGYDKLRIFYNCDMQFPFADSRLTSIVWLHAMCAVT